MLARAAGTGDSSQTALINDSTPTGRLRLITSMANTARCLGAPSGSGRALHAQLQRSQNTKVKTGFPHRATRLPAHRGSASPF